MAGYMVGLMEARIRLSSGSIDGYTGSRGSRPGRPESSSLLDVAAECTEDVGLAHICDTGDDGIEQSVANERPPLLLD